MTGPRPRCLPAHAALAAGLALLAPAAAFAVQDAPAPPPPAAVGDSPGFLGLTPLDWAVQTVPFLIASGIALWFGVERLVVLRTSRVLPSAFLDRFLNLLDSGRMSREDAAELCEESGSPVAVVFAHAVRKWGRPAVEVEQAVIDGGEREVAHLRKHLRILNAVATVTPLMGLLGTVLGMIRAFARIADGGGMGDADQLAAGIVTALLTTALGLTVAIPSLILYFYLSGRVESLVMRMDALAQRVVESVSQEALEERETRRAADRPRSRVKDRDSSRPRDGASRRARPVVEPAAP